MILIFTNSNDSTAQLVERQLKNFGTPFFRLDTDYIGNKVKIGASIDASGTFSGYLKDEDQFVRLEDITAIWNRRPERPKALRLSNPEADAFAEEEMKSLMDGFLRSVEVFWMSHPESIRTAGHKVAQLKRACDMGFNVPETLISMDPERIRSFYSSLTIAGKKMIAKLVSKGPPRAEKPEEQYVVFTQIIEPSDLTSDLTLSAAPAVYQEYIDKEFELRVTVIGQEVLTCRIDSQSTTKTSTDWRRYDFPNTPYSSWELPHDIEAKCLSLTHMYGLNFAAIDLAVTPDGEYVFYELNPNGQWGWIEEITGLPISERIASLLKRAQI